MQACNLHFLEFLAESEDFFPDMRLLCETVLFLQTYFEQKEGLSGFNT
jgi:hypothetical protein